jgi:anti-sigma B factor antagonist
MHEKNATVLDVAGEVDLTTETDLLDAIAGAFAQRPPLLVVDLTDVTFFGSSGRHALTRAHQDTSVPTELRIVAATHATRRPLRITGLDTTLAIYPSLAAALADGAAVSTEHE